MAIELNFIVSYEAIRWCRKFGPGYAQRLKRRQGRLGDTWYLDELFVRINGHQQYLWRAVDQDGDVIDILLQPRRDQRAAERFLRRLVRGQNKLICFDPLIRLPDFTLRNQEGFYLVHRLLPFRVDRRIRPCCTACPPQ